MNAIIYQFYEKFHVTISRPETLQLPLQRKNDVNLMDIMIDEGFGDI